MPIITLTTDWKQNDFYTGALKGTILTKCPDIQIVDISHQIPPFNTSQAAFVIKNSYNHFPKGTIHIIAVDAIPDKGNNYVAIKLNGHFFIGCDNGIFSLIAKDKPENIIQLNKKKKNYPTFPCISLFAETACELAKGKQITELGKKMSELITRIPLRATIDDKVITGSVIYIDSYKNAITNITNELFDRVGKNQPFEIFIQSRKYKITHINKTYSETSIGELLALFNSLGLLEIAMNKANLTDLLSLSIGSTVRIDFLDKKKK